MYPSGGAISPQLVMVPSTSDDFACSLELDLSKLISLKASQDFFLIKAPFITPTLSLSRYPEVSAACCSTLWIFQQELWHQPEFYGGKYRHTWESTSWEFRSHSLLTRNISQYPRYNLGHSFSYDPRSYFFSRKVPGGKGRWKFPSLSVGKWWS